MHLNNVLSSLAIVVLTMSLVSCGTDEKKSAKNETKKEGKSLAIVYCDQVQNDVKQGCVVRPDGKVATRSPTYVPSPRQKPGQSPGQAPSQSPGQKCQYDCYTTQTVPQYDPYKNGCQDQYCGFTKDSPYQNGPWEGNQYQNTPHSKPYSQCYQTYGGGCNNRNFFYGFMLRIGFRIDFSFFSHQVY